MNFLGLPGVGEIVNYLPVFNIVSVPIMCITLRNNLMLLCSISSSQPPTKCSRLLWTFGLSIPCFVVSYLEISTVMLFNITAGMVGVLILGLKGVLIHYAWKHEIERKLGHSNPLKSYFQHQAWIYAVLIITLLLLLANIFLYFYKMTIPGVQYCTWITLRIIIK